MYAIRSYYEKVYCFFIVTRKKRKRNRPGEDSGQEELLFYFFDVFTVNGVNLDRIAFEDMVRNLDNRITSYNVCYTKLLRF